MGLGAQDSAWLWDLQDDQVLVRTRSKIHLALYFLKSLEDCEACRSLRLTALKGLWPPKCWKPAWSLEGWAQSEGQHVSFLGLQKLIHKTDPIQVKSSLYISANVSSDYILMSPRKQDWSSPHWPSGLCQGSSRDGVLPCWLSGKDQGKRIFHHCGYCRDQDLCQAPMEASQKLREGYERAGCGYTQLPLTMVKVILYRKHQISGLEDLSLSLLTTWPWAFTFSSVTWRWQGSLGVQEDVNESPLWESSPSSTTYQLCMTSKQGCQEFLGMDYSG